MRPSIRILLVEDDEDDVIIARDYLSGIDTFTFEVVWEPRVANARLRVLQERFDMMLVDYHLGGENGLELVRFVHDLGIRIPAIILTGQNNLNVDIDASRSGASDYLVKSDLNSYLLERSIRYALSQHKIIRELDEQERKYRSLFERSIDPILLASTAFRLTDVNKSFSALFGYSEDEVKVMNLRQLFDDPADFERYQANLSETEPIKDFEAKLLTRNGEAKHCLLNCIYIPHPTKELCCFQCIVHDLTLHKKAENDMIIAERLSLTGRLARTIAHEVRNPLTNLSLALDQLRRELPRESESGILYTGIIERNANRIEQLVGEMLRSSKPRELNLQLVEVKDIINTAVRLAIDRINLNQIALKVNVGEDLPKVLVDHEKIEVALLNILINAIEAVPRETGVLVISTRHSANKITIAVADNGRGIAPEDVGKLFDPFFTGKPNGLGLGLTSARNILSSHCAEVDVESTLGAGTTFNVHFYLPS